MTNRFIPAYCTLSISVINVTKPILAPAIIDGDTVLTTSIDYYDAQMLGAMLVEFGIKLTTASIGRNRHERRQAANPAAV